MMYYVMNNKGEIELYHENKNFLQNTIDKFKPELKGNPIFETDGLIIDGIIYSQEEYQKVQATKTRNELIEQVNYPLKAKVAYTGVRFDYEGQELVFETNETSISMVNFTAMMAQQAGLSEISNWKCRKTVEPFEPVSVTFTMEQFQKLLTFASQMVLGAFAVEEQINLQIQELTIEQLNNVEFIETFKQQMELAYSQVNTKIENLFASP